MFQLTVEQLQTLVTYLGKRPYQEVFQILAMLSNLPKVEEKEEKANLSEKT